MTKNLGYKYISTSDLSNNNIEFLFNDISETVFKTYNPDKNHKTIELKNKKPPKTTKLFAKYKFLEIVVIKNCLLINSMTQNELNDKYQKCSDYYVEKTETYISSQKNNGINKNNYFHVSVTYCSLNNNFHILIDNKNVDQYLGQNNIVGKYYKGNKVQIGATTDKIKYHINLAPNKLEKIIIGEKKLIWQRKSNFFSLEIIKNIKMIDENANNINEYIDNLKSNNNELNH